MSEEKIVFVEPFYLAEQNVDTTTTDQTATTQDASAETAATGQLTWVTLGSKTYSVTAEVPSCGIAIDTNWSLHLYANGNEIQSGATVTTNDTISAGFNYTVRPEGPGCAGYGIVAMEVWLDNSLKATPQKSYAELTSSKSDSISYTIGKLSAGDHTIKLVAKYANNPPT